MSFLAHSGVGKGTIVKEVIKDPQLNTIMSVSHTTRKKREGEKQGINYFYVSKTKFRDMIINDQFVEWAEHFGNFYGTSRAFVEKNLKQNRNVLLEIESIGAKQVIKKIPWCNYDFYFASIIGNFKIKTCRTRFRKCWTN